MMQWNFLAPIGYLNVRYNGKANIILDSVRAPAVKALFEIYATGEFSIQDLMILADSWHLFPKRRYSISKRCVNNLLKNPFYYGYMRIKGDLFPHNYPKLIDKDLFDTVQRTLLSKRFRV
ncbi:MAG: recombinase family protein [Alphaproteobacteria bacterium]|nr:recombinase family protein [Alphaproteobacteria bacterium]